jgi:clusterin-associated protein 1
MHHPPQLLSTKARVTLRAKSLYAADGRAVKELLKLATLLYEYVCMLTGV